MNVIDRTVRPAAAAPAAWPIYASLLQMQQWQLNAWVAWQQWMTSAAQDVYDCWACHFAGGAPIDA